MKAKPVIGHWLWVMGLLAYHLSPITPHLIAPRASAAAAAPVLADPDTGELFRPTQAVGISGNVTGNVTVGSGKTLTAAAGSTVTLNGILAGTPTSGTLNLSGLTALTLPATVSGGGASFQPASSVLSDFAQTGQRYVIAGDSLSDINYSASRPEIGAGNNWSQKIASMSAFSGRGTFVYTAVSGRKIDDLVANYATEVYPYRPSNFGSSSKSFLFVWIGNNDIGVTALATMQSSWASYCSTARSDGFTVVAFTVTPRTSTYWTASNYSDLASFNNYVRQSSNWDYLVDVATLFPNPSDTALIYDGIHLNAASNLLLARFVNGVVYSRHVPPASPFDFPRIANYGTYSGSDSLSITKSHAGLPFNGSVRNTSVSGFANWLVGNDVNSEIVALGAGGSSSGASLGGYGYIYTYPNANGFRLFTNGTMALTVNNSQAVTFAGAATFSGASTFSSAATFTAAATFSSTASFAGAISASDTLTLTKSLAGSPFNGAVRNSSVSGFSNWLAGNDVNAEIVALGAGGSSAPVATMAGYGYVYTYPNASGFRLFTNGTLAFTVNNSQLTTFSGGVSLVSAPPASATAAGVAGTITWDANFIYVCTATNTWKRAALSTW